MILTQYSTDQPEVHEVIAEMRRVIDEFDDRVLIGEIYLPIDRLVAYYGKDLRGAQMPFNFALLSTMWSARQIEAIIADYEGRCRSGAGRTGCSAITTGRGSQPGRRRSRRGSPRCCC